MATIRDVALHAGVSAGTVSNVLNRPSYVSAEVRRRVLDSISALAFTPSDSARKFRPGRERTLGLVVADLGNPFFVDVTLGADAEAKVQGVGVVMVHNGLDRLREEQNLDVLIQQRVHGIIITPVEEENSRLEELAEQGIPIVYVDRISGDRPCCWVRTDDVAGGRLAGEHLIERGHRRLMYAGGTRISHKVDARYDGFLTAIEAGDGRVERVETQSWRLEDGARVAELLFARRREEWPTAVMCANDLIALGLMQRLALAGIRIPEDVALVGFDDLEWAGAAVIPLSSVRQQRAELGRRAVRLLMDELLSADTHVHVHEELEPTLVIRDSSAIRRTD
ncbi:MAG: LacI family DNA-binding transcriptional regulator [Pseudolysinimonas sp.]|uniref:LacI family DNA-binding transcriptional regulator n=1 Tax=Pseudolysinimonas sp. TaxID=2680009 RepID=UPI003263BCF9